MLRDFGDDGVLPRQLSALYAAPSYRSSGCSSKWQKSGSEENEVTHMKRLEHRSANTASAAVGVIVTALGLNQ